jgi:hypothetical protein
MNAPEPPIRTRCGYIPSELLKSFEKTLTESGTVATGKVLHYAADIVCSGGITLLLPVIWSYAILHVGLASPRIVVYLKKRVAELEDILRRIPDETAYQTEELQIRLGEMILVIRDAPTRSIVPWPKVGAETHNEGWIRAAAGAPETTVLRAVWRPEGDTPILRTAGAELCKAITDGSTEKALFWIKWMFEEEGKVKKEVKGASLTTIDRGPPGKGKASGTGFFIMALFGEIYKEMAAKQLVRMHEEFQALLDLWRSKDANIGGGSKKHILIILVQILCEVPRWKVPAAPALIKDPVVMSRAIREVPKFFREVLAYDPPKGMSTKAFKVRIVEKKAAKKVDTAIKKMDAFDSALEAYFARM